MSTNRVFLTGRLTRDIELRTAGKSNVASFGLAVSENYRNQAGETVEKVHFFDIVSWGKQAEACAKHLKKGSPVLIEGKLQMDRWETNEGQKRSRIQVRTERVQFLGTNPANAKTPNPEGATAN